MSTTLSIPARNASAVTASDSTALSGVRGVYVGGAGNLAVRFIGGATVTLAAVPAGTLLPLMVDRIMSTNTTATDIVALY
jgi:hypothetical protein